MDPTAPEFETIRLDLSNMPAEVLSARLPIELGRYRLMSVLGEGGMARVFRATLHGPAGFKKTVAIKVLKKKEGRPSGREGLVQEAVLACRLHHPNIVDIYELVEEQGQTFIAMEWVDGSTLSQLIRSGPPMPPSVVLDFSLALLDGIEYAHTPQVEGDRPGMLHKDIKPANILVSRHGIPKLVDFGIAAQLQTEPPAEGDDAVETLGTLSWMSPEQLLGDVLDERSDLFALGLIIATVVLCGHPLPEKFLYRTLLAGELPPMRLLAERYEASIDRVIPGLGAILERLLRRDREQRHRTASELRAELSALRDRVGYQPTLSRWVVDRDLVAPGGSSGVSDETTRDEREPAPAVEETTHVVARGNLQEDADPFFGRVDESATLQELVARGVRLITLVGTGGCGKTRLCRRVAADFVERLEGGAWFVDLSSVESEEGVVRATASALGVSLSADARMSATEELGIALKRLGRVLIVMDNFEQVIDAAASTVGRWLEMAPAAQFLVTTRETLKLAGERRVELSPLSQEEAVALLLQAVQDAGGLWSEDPETCRVLAEIVETLDRLPLAIELAAARARLLTPLQLRDRLSERFKLLRSDVRDRSARQSTLHGLIDWSWQRLEPWEQSALAQLSIFRGGFTMDAAEAVLDISPWAEAPWSLDVVGGLLQKSLLYSTHRDGQPRFFIYVSIQEFAALRLAEERSPCTGQVLRDAVHGRHARFFSRLQSPVQRGSGGGRSVRTLEREFENLEAGSRRGGLPYGVLCALGALDLLMARGPMSRALELIEEHAGAPGLPPHLEVRLRVLQTQCLRLSGRMSEARAALGVARRHMTEWSPVERPVEGGLQGDGRGAPVQDRTRSRLEVESRLEQAHLLRLEGKLDEAHEVLEAALEWCDPRMDSLLQSRVLFAHGWLMWTRGRVGESLSRLQRARAGFRVAGERIDEALTLSALAYVTYLTGQPVKAHPMFQECLYLLDEFGGASHIRKVLSKLANVECAMGHFVDSLAHFDEVIRLQDQAGDVANGLINRLDRASTLIAMGRAREAEEELQEIWVRTRSQESPAFEALARVSLGDLFLDEGRLEEAEPHLRAALDVVRGRFPTIEASVSASLAVVLSAWGERDYAESLLENQEHVLSATPLSRITFLVCSARVSWNLGDRDEAWSRLARATEIASEVDAGPGCPTLVRLEEWRQRWQREASTDGASS